MCLVLSLSVFASISLSLSLYFASHFHAVPQPRRPEAVFDIFFEFLANYFSDPRIVNPDLKEVLLEVLSVCLSSLSLLLSLSLLSLSLCSPPYAVLQELSVIVATPQLAAAVERHPAALRLVRNLLVAFDSRLWFPVANLLVGLFKVPFERSS
jgi:hypothetical protein